MRLTADVPVMIVGAGPVGLTLAAGLAKQGIRSIVLEKKTRLDEHSRALVVVARTLELLNSYNMADRFMEEGCFLRELQLHDVDRDKVAFGIGFEGIVDETTYPGMLVLPQNRLEHLLLEQVLETGLTEVRFGHEVDSYTEEAEGVVVSFRDSSAGQTKMTASFLVGCDGAHSSIRQAWGEKLEGITFPIRVFLCDLHVPDSVRDELPFPRFHSTDTGQVGAIRYEPFHWRLIGFMPAGAKEEEALRSEQISKLVACLLGPGTYETIWTGMFSIHQRIAPSFRKGRVLLAGDAAHISSPAGGQGMNSGMQDAENLAWKLALALKGGSMERLLDSYEQERRSEIASGVLPFTTNLTRLVLHRRLGRIVLWAGKLALRSGRFQRVAARRLAMLGTRYKDSPLLSGERKWVGRRAPGRPLRGPILISFDASAEILRETEQAILQVASDDRLPVIVNRTIEKTDPLWRAWKARSDLVVLVRPDEYVGWAAIAPTTAETLAGVRNALGLTRGERDGGSRSTIT